ncbi:MAG: FAD-dependent oxidoreductase [Eubacteriales bacterium]|nr:FAD-dependent oxidoreductase [Eubacteriales bacterium]
MQSIWSQEISISQHGPLNNNIETDTAVIGGGLAGILIAYFLQQRGIPVVVLEAGRIGSGQTRNTTAKITSQHNLIYSKLIRNFGIERARQYAQANQAAIHAYRKIIQERHIDCDFEAIPAYLYTCTNPDLLKQEAEAAQCLGINANFTQEINLPFSVKGAVRFEDQAQFHPLKFLSNISEEVTVYEQTNVRTVDGNLLHTNHGNVKARHIVFATHYPFVNFPGMYFARMHQERSYVLALRHAQQLDGAYLGIDDDGCSFRNAGDLLLLGGGSHRTGINQAGGQYEALQKNAQIWYPNSTEVARWSAQDCIPIDDVPYIGRFARSKPNWFVATGFQKWGMTSSMVAATLLPDLIRGQPNAYAEVFSPQRFYLRASAKKLSANIGQFTKSLAKRAFGTPDLTLDKLPKEHGGVVSANGKKVGAYKDKTGKVYLVSVRCPHLGCELAWNPEERSWDCPCHGSRFDYTGKRISGPAQTDITLHAEPTK